MFTWYQEAKVCIVFLRDVTIGSTDCTASEWFTRGWTLQELIAPHIVEFFDRNWEFIGTKLSRSSRISWKTGISVEILTGDKALEEVPVAVRMSWASQRQTKRTEDLAYSLLGIFDINMPMLYGEGSKAFIRLQEEIIKQNDDISIFAWCDADTNSHEISGLLATSPAHFTGMHNIEPSYHVTSPTLEFSITNRGIRVNSDLFFDKENGNCVLPLLHQRTFEEPCPNDSSDQSSISLFVKAAEDSSNTLTETRAKKLGDCSDSSHIASFGSLRKRNLGIKLCRVGQGRYVRAQPSELTPLEDGFAQHSVFHVAKSLTTSQISNISSCKIRIEEPTDLSHSDFQLDKVMPAGSWVSLERTIYVGEAPTFLGYMVFSPSWADDYASFAIIFSCSQTWVGVKRRFWNYDLMEFKADRQRESPIFQYDFLRSRLIGRPISLGKHCSSIKSIELEHSVKQYDYSSKIVEVTCTADNMGLGVRITIDHRNRDDTDG